MGRSEHGPCSSHVYDTHWIRLEFAACPASYRLLMCPYVHVAFCKYCFCAGLPRVLVDIRHEATHNELPSLALLRLAAGRALDWLRVNYWQAQADHIAAEHARIRQLLQVRCGCIMDCSVVLIAVDSCMCVNTQPRNHGRDYVLLSPHAAYHDRVCGVSQDYCCVQRAAAEKLFTHSGSQPDLAAEDVSDAEQGNAEAAPYIVHVPPAEAPASGYQAAEGRRQRQKLLGMLREAVPPSAARMLVDSLLDASFCTPPNVTAPGEPALSPGVRLHAEIDSGQPHDDEESQAANQRHGHRVTAEVWRTAMAALAQQWPPLPALLALGAMERFPLCNSSWTSR